MGLLKAHRNENEWFVMQVQIAPALQGRLYDRLGFEIVGEDDTQFHMRLAARAPAESEAERMSDKD